MLSQNRARRVVEEAEQTYLQCWEILRGLKALSIDAEKLLSFQPLLASALLAVDRLYHAAGRERRRLIERKASYNVTWFSHRMRLLRRYQNFSVEAAKRGRLLGNTFAWLFYHREERRLLDHLQHPSIGRISGGVGGFVEVDFIRRFRLLEGGIMPFLHSLTTFRI